MNELGITGDHKGRPYGWIADGGRGVPRPYDGCGAGWANGFRDFSPAARNDRNLLEYNYLISKQGELWIG